MQEKQGVLIAFEGIDGAGKTTIAHAVANHLRNQQYSVLLTKEPGGSALGSLIRTIIQNKTIQLCPQSEYLLFAADRAQHMQEIILPALRKGDIVISDRLVDSSLAYQGYGRGIDLGMIKMINQWVMQQQEPDLVIYIQIDAQTAQERINKRGNASSFDEQSKAFFELLIKGYEQIFASRNNIMYIDGTQPANVVIDNTITRVLQWMSGHLITA